MASSLALTALIMGLAGGPHCVAMCGAACAGIGQRAGRPHGPSLWAFQLGRLAGYCALGGFAAASVQGLGWLSVHSAALRPVWSLLHLAAAMIGLIVLWQARQPAWLDLGARHVWTRVRSVMAGGGGRVPAAATPLLMGSAWALLPCGLLYSALLVAALSASPLDGAYVMAAFAVGSGISLMAGPWLWLRLQGPRAGRWAIRVAGAALMVSSLWALWMGLMHDAAPWCISP